jgi:phenylalanyl-tRNA synthetase beta chain
MKVSLNWLKEYIGADLSPEKVSEILTQTGLEVEHVENIGPRLDGLIVGEVVAATKHPNADKLNCTQVSVGTDTLLNIVCGAPNVDVGQKVIVAPVGCLLHPSQGESFEIKKAKIRGEVSEGMLCADDEIGLGENHDGIHILPAETPVGISVAQALGSSSDTVFEVAITPNRTDAISHIGVARDIAAFLRIPVIYPEYPKKFPNSDTHPIAVDIQDLKHCGHYMAVVVKNVKVGPSPIWMQQRLNAVGVRPINNIVDATNYVMLETGQPLHAFDFEKSTGKIQIGNSIAGSTFEALDGKKYTLTGAELMVKNESEDLAMAGVIGGMSSSITDETKNILIESAWFDASIVRATSKRFELKTDAAYRFERGTDPNGPRYAALRVVSLILEIAGGMVGGETEIYPNPIEAPQIHLSMFHLEKYLGFKVNKQDLKTVLEHLDIRIVQDYSDVLLVETPTYRTDVTREIDVIEEFLRIYGYENIPFTGVVAFGDTFPRKARQYRIKQLTSFYLANNGFFEIMNNSLTSKEAVDFIDLPEEEIISLMNPLSEELSILRNNLLYGGLKTISYNLSRQQHHLKFFEFGVSHTTRGGKFFETELLGIWLTGNNHEDHWYEAGKKTDFYQLNAMVHNIFQRLHIQPTEVSEFKNKIFNNGLKYKYKNRVICEIGRVNQPLLKKIDIKQDVYYARISWENIKEIASSERITFREPSKFPAVERDLALVVDKKILFRDLRQSMNSLEISELESMNVFDVYEGKSLDSNKKSYGLKFVFRNPTRTLKSEEVDQIMQKLMATFEQQNGAVIRQ